MIERLIPHARRIIAVATAEAEALGSPLVGDEHLALALVVQLPMLFTRDAGLGGFSSPTDVPSAAVGRALLRRDTHDALATLGISLDEIERRVEEAFGPDAWSNPSERGRLQFSRDARYALTLALRRSLNERRSRILDSDILAGVVKANGRGRRLLAELGVDVDELEQRVDADTLFAPGPGFR